MIFMMASLSAIGIFWLVVWGRKKEHTPHQPTPEEAIYKDIKKCDDGSLTGQAYVPLYRNFFGQKRYSLIKRDPWCKEWEKVEYIGDVWPTSVTYKKAIKNTFGSDWLNKEKAKARSEKQRIRELLA